MKFSLNLIRAKKLVIFCWCGILPIAGFITACVCAYLWRVVLCKSKSCLNVKMEIFGIRFAPLSIPLNRRLQTLAAGAWHIYIIIGPFVATGFTVYLLFCTRLWWLTLLYIFWIYLDRDVHENGGRLIESTRDWIWWKYLRDYFPVTLKVLPDVKLDPKRNYIFGCYPHGMLATGVLCSFGTHANESQKTFPDHIIRVVILPIHFIWPFYRELLIALGGISSTVKAMGNVLGNPEGGTVLSVIVGGASEAHYCCPGRYKIILKSRKGFVKLALYYGTPLVPVFTFGETDLYDQIAGPRLRRIQDIYKKCTGVAPIILRGRGFLQYSCGIVPQRRPLTVVVGKPIEVEKVANPSSEQINTLHDKFTQGLIRLFEDHKHLYLEDAGNVCLEIV